MIKKSLQTYYTCRKFVLLVLLDRKMFRVFFFQTFKHEVYRVLKVLMSKFHNYSINNTLLIAMQKPDASLVAGFSAWKNNFGRNVMKGQKGIKIIAPSPYKVKQEMKKIDPHTQQPIIGKDGKPVTEEKEITIPAYKVVSVFDVSQTEGKELPDIAVDELTGDVERYRDFFAALEKTSPVPIGFEQIPGSSHGYYHLEDKRIAIQEGMSELQTLKTAIHEIAHAKLHDIDLNAPENEQQPRVDRRTREVEAETGPIATPTGYSVSMGADQTVAAGETVSIPVTVASSKHSITGFNAYDMTFTYDPAALTLNTASDAAANLTVEDGGGTVRVRRYGETAPLGEALTLDFTAKKGATSTVTLTEAKFDLDANSINFDAPAATIADADTKVTGLWNVTLPEGFRSAGGVNTVEDGKDFTFTAPDAHYDYTLNVTTNGKTDQVTMKGNKSYTIENVTDNVTVTEVSRTAKTYTLKFVVDDRSAEYLQRDPLTLANLGITDETVEVQYPNNYVFTVKFPGSGRYLGVTISPDKNRFVSPLGDRSENGDCTYTLDGSKLTGDENGEITITINVYAWRNQITIGVGGNGAEDFDSGNELTCYPTENYTFTVNKSQYYDYTVRATYWQKKLSGYWDTVSLTVKDNGDGTYTIASMPNITEHYELTNVDVTITITKTAKAVDPNAVSAYEYLQLDGKTMVLVLVNGKLDSGKVFTYEGSPMFKAGNYGFYVYSWLLILDKGEALDVDALKADVISKLALDDGTATTISQVYDVNKSGVVDINDAQLVYDIYNGTYGDFTKVSMEKFLLADVNTDKMVNSSDAVAIVGRFR